MTAAAQAQVSSAQVSDVEWQRAKFGRELPEHMAVGFSLEEVWIHLLSNSINGVFLCPPKPSGVQLANSIASRIRFSKSEIYSRVPSVLKRSSNERIGDSLAFLDFDSEDWEGKAIIKCIFGMRKFLSLVTGDPNPINFPVYGHTTSDYHLHVKYLFVFLPFLDLGPACLDVKDVKKVDGTSATPKEGAVPIITPQACPLFFKGQSNPSELPINGNYGLFHATSGLIGPKRYGWVVSAKYQDERPLIVDTAAIPELGDLFPSVI